MMIGSKCYEHHVTELNWAINFVLKKLFRFFSSKMISTSLNRYRRISMAKYVQKKNKVLRWWHSRVNFAMVEAVFFSTVFACSQISSLYR